MYRQLDTIPGENGCWSKIWNVERYNFTEKWHDLLLQETQHKILQNSTEYTFEDDSWQQ